MNAEELTPMEVDDTAIGSVPFPSKDFKTLPWKQTHYFHGIIRFFSHGMGKTLTHWELRGKTSTVGGSGGFET